MSLYNFFIKHGKLPPQHGNLLTKAKTRPTKDSSLRHYKPPTTDLRFSLLNSNVTISRQVDLLQNINLQDVIHWIGEIRSIITISDWNSDTALAITKSFISQEILDHIPKINSVENLFDSLIKLKYSSSQLYLTQGELTNIHQEKYYLIDEYFNEIQKRVKLYGTIKKTSDKQMQDRTDEIFMNNLSVQTRLEPSRLKIQYAKEALLFIKQQEDIIITGNKNGSDFEKPSLPNNYQNLRNGNKNTVSIIK